ncbi:hypothetical protein SeMB42_g00007 [Synchytrium endobioticum]|nr:hypothetical protein SeMB42_g00007 [Synchytrium endobioticum]
MIYQSSVKIEPMEVYGILTPSAEAQKALKQLDFPVVDSHHHLWEVQGDTPRIQAAWAAFDFEKHGFENPKTPRVTRPAGYKSPPGTPTDEELAASLQLMLNTLGSTQAIFNTYLSADHIALIEQEAAVKLHGSVYIECGWQVHNVENAQAGETKYIEETSHSRSGGKVSTGIIGHTDLLENTVEQTRSELRAHYAASPHFRGIRYQLAHPGEDARFIKSCPEEGVARKEPFLMNFAVLEEFGTTFDIWCYGHQLKDAIFLATKFPEVKMVLDHFGTPIDIATKPEVYDAWLRDMTELSKLPNVQVKMSGLMPQLGFQFEKRHPCTSAGATAREIVHSKFGNMVTDTVKLFGVDRVMYGSNGPVDYASARLSELLAAYVICCEVAGVSQVELKKIFRENALRFYRLDM